jgi:hypothetical protein
MSKVTVTSELRKVLKSLNLGTGRHVFSDSRKPKGQKAAGVKFCGLQVTDSQKAAVVTEMEKRGFKFHYARLNTGRVGYYGGYYQGTRFCFSKIN